MSDHWLVRPDTIRKLWIGSIVALVLLVATDLWIHHHAHFGLDGTFGFYAWFGFLCCVAMVVGSKVLGAMIKRPDTYYDD